MISCWNFHFCVLRTRVDIKLLKFLDRVLYCVEYSQSQPVCFFISRRFNVVVVFQNIVF